MYYSTLFNLACLTHEFHEFHPYHNNYCFDPAVFANTLSMLCVTNRLWCVPAPPPRCQYDPPSWGFPFVGKPKRKRGGRRKICVMTGRRPESAESRRHVCHSNLTLVNTNGKKKQNNLINIGLLNTRSVTGKENLIEDLIIEKDFDFFFSTETWLHPSGDERFPT